MLEEDPVLMLRTHKRSLRVKCQIYLSLMPKSSPLKFAAKGGVRGAWERQLVAGKQKAAKVAADSRLFQTRELTSQGPPTDQ